MKKLLLLLGAATALTASAANPPKQIFRGSLQCIPQVFTVDGKSILAATTDDQIIAYNSNFDVLTTINLPQASEIEVNSWSQRREYGYKDLTLTETIATGNYIYADYWDEDGNHHELFFTSPEEAIEYLRNHGNQPEVSKLNGETIIITRYRTDANYGQKYIVNFYKFVNGLWREYENIYQEGEWGPYGEWEEKYDNTYTATIPAYTEIQLGGADYDDSPATQTLFNDDHQFEYVVPNIKKIEYSNMTETYREGGEKVVATGYSVMSQNGNKLYDIDIPVEYNVPYYHYLLIYILDGKKYIAIDAEDNNHDDCTLLYELDSTGGIKAPKIFKGSMKVSPATPQHGQAVNVDLGSEADGATVVNVVSANGSTVRTLPVAAGRRNVSLPTEGLASGLYIITANGREAAKIIIR